MNKHTPGPWSINKNKIDGNGYHIVSVNSHATSEGIANAKLIAAAPDLFEALKIAQSMIAVLGGTPDPSDPNANQIQIEVQKQVADAIAKATGE